MRGRLLEDRGEPRGRGAYLGEHLAVRQPSPPVRRPVRDPAADEVARRLGARRHAAREPSSSTVTVIGSGPSTSMAEGTSEERSSARVSSSAWPASATVAET